MRAINNFITKREDALCDVISKFKHSYASVTFSLVIINCLVFFFDYQPTAVLDNPLSWLTYMFGHASIEHLMGNMLFLTAFGPRVEMELGHRKFLYFWLICGVASALGFFMFMPDARLIGASGAISGVMAVYPFIKRDILTKVAALIPVGFWFFMNFSAALNPFASRVAYIGHLAGGAMGLIFLIITSYRKH